jgi:hypothetical protein
MTGTAQARTYLTAGVTLNKFLSGLGQGRAFTISDIPVSAPAGVIQIGSHGTISAVKSQGRMVVVGSQAGAEVVGSLGRSRVTASQAKAVVTKSQAKVDVGD